MDDTAPRWSPPGWGNTLVAAAASAVIVAGWCRWWPTDNAAFFTSAAASMVLLAAGVVWLFDTVRHLWVWRAWTWRIAAAPAVVVGAALVVVVAQPTFEGSRAEFDRVAAQLLAEPGGRSGPLRVGRYDVSRAYTTSGEVYFVDAHSMFMTETGWAYSPGGPPRRYGEFTAEHIDGPWYRYTYVYT